ncbi:MAG: patatin-like phospholipase family protein [Acidobacteriia bacterium]|nr:patatin-like phospholipase family protein [Terriglobia bacterium]
MKPCSALCGLLLLLAAPLAAADAAGCPEGKPRIGLILEGGSALGLAHIGVIEWLEQHRIPVDLVAGTSMGGLVGGLYSSGQSPAELRQLVSTLDWTFLLTGQIPFPDLAFRRKQDRIAFPNHLEFGLRNGISLPPGLNSGQEVGFLFDRSTLPYGDMKSFDDLPIPFRCVGTDLVSGKSKVFDNGSLSQALRTTMSLPALFLPVNKDKAQYVDGSLLNNLPVDVAKQLGACVLIAVHLDPGGYKPKDGSNLLGVMGRSAGIMIAANELRNLQLADIVITVDLHDVESMDFKKALAIADKGFRAAETKSGILSKLAVSEAEWSAYLARRNARKVTVTPVPQSIAIEGATPRDAIAVARRLSKYIGQPVTPNALETTLRSIAGEGRYASLNYGITNRAGQQSLAIRAVEKSQGPPFLLARVQMDGSDVDNVRFSMGGRLTFLDLGGYRSELRTDFSFGGEEMLGAEYFRPFGPARRLFVSPHASTHTQTVDFSNRDQRIAEYRLGQDRAGIDAGIVFNRSAEFRAGMDFVHQRTTLRIGDPILSNGSFSTGIATVRFNYFGQDDMAIPRRGVRLNSDFQYFTTRSTAGGGFPQAETRLSLFQPVSKPASIYFSAAGGSTFGTNTDTPDTSFFTLGGPFRLGAYNRNELIGHQYYLFSAGYLHEVFTLPPVVGGQVYLAGWYEAGKMFGYQALPKLPNSASGAILLNTAIGPAFFGGSWGDRGRRNWYFGIGRLF